MRNHGDLVLRLYGQARGRAAEFWGERYLASDRWVATVGVPQRARAWYQAQSPLFGSYLDAFAEGINEFARTHPERLGDEAAAVLPVVAVDVVAHAQRVVNFAFVVDLESIVNAANAQRRFGSNAWAVAPSRSATGRAMLLTNPHMPWGDMFLPFEAHLNAPGIGAYGIALVGFPVLAMAFNDFLGWSHTVNAHTGWTLYRLELAPGGYRIDDAVRAFDVEETVLKVRTADGSLRDEPMLVRRSVHGPVVEKDGEAFAVRISGLSRPRALEQWWNMARATDLAQFEVALQDMQIPMFTVLYADRDGHIMHLFNGQVPVRDTEAAVAWSGIVPGNASAHIWTETHPYCDLPRVVDPVSGWLQNANDPPWTTTFPQALHPDDYPNYMAPRGPMSLRAQRSARVLMEHERLTLDEMVKQKYSTVMELATRVLDELVEAARRGAPKARAAADVLAAWDRRADAESRGAVLFAFWSEAMDADHMFAVAWDERFPLTTPRGLADPAAAVAMLVKAATKVQTLYEALDVRWGDVFRLRTRQVDVPANGADKAGVFPELWFLPTEDDRFAAVGGDSYAAAIEFADPVRALVLNVCGNATQPGATRADEQLKLFSRKQMRPAWLRRAQIVDNLSSREVVTRR